MRWSPRRDAVPGARGCGWPHEGFGPEEGFASVVVLALACVVTLVAAVLVALGSVAVTRHRVASTADLAALAAAGRAPEGQPAACAAAAVVVKASGASLVGCSLVGAAAEVQVTLQPAGPLGALGSASARARAGPAPG